MGNSCTLGKPFSANNMYTVSKGRIVKTKKYRDWSDYNLPLVIKDMTPAKSFPVKIYIQVMDGYGWNDKRDTDNIIKPLLDLLVKSGILPDDNHKFVEHVEARYLPWPGKKSEALTFIRYEEKEAE